MQSRTHSCGRGRESADVWTRHTSLTQSKAAYSSSPFTFAAGWYMLVKVKTKRKQINYVGVIETTDAGALNVQVTELDSKCNKWSFEVLEYGANSLYNMEFASNGI